MDKIDRFDRTEYDFLSNFCQSPIHFDRLTYFTVEHFYQAMKTLDAVERENIRIAPGPGSAKRLGQKVTLRTDWEEIKNDIMFTGLILKFTQNPTFGILLANTGDTLLEEGNTWGDKYWGTVNGEGKNMLGKLLMKVRVMFFTLISKEN